MQPIKMQLSQNQTIFSLFFLHFRNLYKTWNTLKENMFLRGSLFLKL